MLSSTLLAELRQQQGLLWTNPGYGQLPVPAGFDAQGTAVARARLQRAERLLATLFPELAAAGGRITSPLLSLPTLAAQSGLPEATRGSWWLKADHALPVAGSIKARGGFHEVLAFAEAVGLRHGLLQPCDDLAVLATPAARAVLQQYRVAVGSTGNLGMSIGLMAAALGFGAEVHMSIDAKEWKKQRLRNHGVKVVEHTGDYAKAVAAGRALAEADARTHFVDDEQSRDLFDGYAVAAEELAAQLQQAGRVVDAAHPLFVYLPCGVGGAPGGITWGLKSLWGPHVHCFFAEPVASPCMLVQLAAGETPTSVYDIGLDNRTEADGLAVGLASPLVAPLMASQLSGVFTVRDEALMVQTLDIYEAEGIALEPSAAAGLPGPRWLLDSAAGQAYVQQQGLGPVLGEATHVVWATGGSLVPEVEHQRFREQGARLRSSLQA